jgi:hypothetical protein
MGSFFIYSFLLKEKLASGQAVAPLLPAVQLRQLARDLAFAFAQFLRAPA